MDVYKIEISFKCFIAMGSVLIVPSIIITNFRRLKLAKIRSSIYFIVFSTIIRDFFVVVFLELQGMYSKISRKKNYEKNLNKKNNLELINQTN